VQYRRLQTRLLQRPSMRRTQGHFQQVPARPKQPGEGRLPTLRTRRLLRSLQWLPVRPRVTYKVALTSYKVRSTATPAATMQTPTLTPSLRSADGRTRTNTGLARRALSATAHPSICNSLYPSMFDYATARLHSNGMTHLFTLSFTLLTATSPNPRQETKGSTVSSINCDRSSLI